MKTHIQRVFRDLERDTERVSAHLRLLIAAVLAVLYLTSDNPDPHGLLAPGLAAYGVIALIAIGLAYRAFYRPWLPWVFVTFDVAVLWLMLEARFQSMGMSAMAALTLPSASLIFVILAHAAMRHRPALVAYAAGLFLAAWLAALLGFGDTAGGMGPGHRPGARMTAVATPWHATLQEVARAAMVALTAVILIVTVMRTRQRVLQSIIEARRAANLSRYMPESLVEQLSYEGVESVRGSRLQDAAVMFVDIRGFTTLSESLDPAELGSFLGEFRNRLSVPIGEHHGTIDKFIGDAIMAVFGIPDPGSEDAKNALDCASDMLATLERWNRERRAQGLDPVAVGIGLHFGPVLAGALGDENRMEYTVIGDTVNVAERLEKLTRDYDTAVVVSEDLLRAARRHPPPAAWERLPVDALKGRAGEIVAYRLRSPVAETGRAPAQAAG